MLTNLSSTVYREVCYGASPMLTNTFRTLLVLLLSCFCCTLSCPSRTVIWCVRLCCDACCRMWSLKYFDLNMVIEILRFKYGQWNIFYHIMCRKGETFRKAESYHHDCNLINHAKSLNYTKSCVVEAIRERMFVPVKGSGKAELYRPHHISVEY